MNKGFTLLETLIAIAIMTVAVGAAFGMAQKSLQSSYQSKNQVTASFLAAEGLEMVRNIRDNVAFYNKNQPTNLQVDWIAPFHEKCMSTGLGCDIDPLADPEFFQSQSATDAAITACPAQGCQLNQIVTTQLIGGQNIKTNEYTWLDGPPSIYYRSIFITCNPQDCSPDNNGKREAIVTSTVTVLGQTVSLSETLNNWYQI